jgi:MFS family permease
VWLLWSFAPGSSTPLQYFLQNSLHATDAQWGEWNAIFVAGFIPTFLLFGWLCQRFPLRSILFWSTLVAVPQMVPLVFIHDVNQSFAAAALIGLLGGVNSAAYLDLVIRSCPPGLQGAVLMMWWSLFYIAVRFGDVLGTYLYDHFHNFNVCVIAITVVYALILPVLQLVPRNLTATADGQAAPAR